MQTTDIKTGVACAVVLLMLVPSTAAAVKLDTQASVSPSRVGVGEAVKLTVQATAHGRTDIRTVGDPDVGSAFRIGQTGHSTRTVRINNDIRVTETFTYRLTALEKGRHTVTPPDITAGGQQTSPASQTVQVVESTGDDSRRRDRRERTRANNKVFVRSVVEPTESPYLGQQITLVYHLMTDPQVFRVRPHPPKEPSLDSFWIEDLSRKLSRRTRTTTFQGKMYKRTTLRAYALFPLESGDVEIEPMTLKAEIGNPFSKNTKELETETTTLKVRPLPDGAPSGFYEGNVGDWNFEARLEADRTELGAPVTFELEVRGSGNVRRVQLPTPPDVDGLAIDRIDESVETELRGSKLHGSKTVTYRISPQKEGAFEIPPVSFAYFDPERETYRTPASRTFDLTVRGGSLPDHADDGDDSTANDTDGEDEADPIDRLLGKLRGPVESIPDQYDRSRVETSSTFLGLTAVPSAGILLLLIVPVLARGWRRLRGRNADRRAARRRARTLLDEARRADPPEAASGIARALTAYFHLRWGIPKGTVTAAEIEDKLGEIDLPPSARSTTVSLLEWAEQARFAPAADISSERVDSALQEADALVETLDELGDDGDDENDKDNSSGTGPATAAILLVAAGAGLVVASGHVRADDDFQSRVDRALKAQKAGEWADAVDRWQSLTATRPDHPDLLYNLGTAAARDRQFGTSRLALERAALHNPNARTRHNLDLIAQIVDRTRLERAGSQSTILPSAAAGMSRWQLARSLPASVPPWVLAGALWVLFLGMLGRRFLSAPSRARWSATAAVVLGLTAAVLAAAVWGARTRTLSTVRPAVVTSENVTLRDGPSRHADLRTPEFPVVAGTTGRVLNERDGWAEVAISTEVTGWVPAEAVSRVDSPG